MTLLALQISPEAKSAYFHDYVSVAEAELKWVTGLQDFEYVSFGALEFFKLEWSTPGIQLLLRLSFVQGVFEITDQGFLPLNEESDWRLHDDFVFGSKFKGKTNERLTQLLINVGTSFIPERSTPLKLLDPMAGRSTTLLWAMRYGMNSWGIEQDAKALEDVRQIIKKWTKIHRQKHQLSDGFIGKQNKKNLGKFIDFKSSDRTLRLTCGDAQLAHEIYKKEKFDLIVSDLPYGVQHFTTEGTRNPVFVLKECVDGWKDRLKKDGVIVLAFNSNIPKRPAIIELFEHFGLIALPFEAPHRMSESIVRDIVIFKNE